MNDWNRPFYPVGPWTPASWWDCRPAGRVLVLQLGRWYAGCALGAVVKYRLRTDVSELQLSQHRCRDVIDYELRRLWERAWAACT